MKFEPFTIALSLSCVLALPTACSDTPADATDPRPSTAVAIERVSPRAVAETLSVPGLVEAHSRIELAFRVTGFVKAFEVDEGDRVEAGAVLARLDEADLEREVRAARAALERARITRDDTERSFERQRDLFARNSTSQQAHDAAQSTFAVARAVHDEAQIQLETAEDRLGKATLRAPIAGVVEKRLLEAHELATAQSPVLVLVELDTVKVRAAVSDSQLAQLEVGLPATIRTALWPERSFSGKIVRIDVAANRATRTFPFEVELANPDLALRPELVVGVEVALGDAELRTLVPLASVLRHTDTTPFCFVAVAGEDGDHVERRQVEVGGVYQGRVEIISGLRAGERVLTRGQHFVGEGDSVHVVPLTGEG